MDALEAVCFDLDGTLCVPTQDDEEIHEAVFERVGVEPIFEPADLYAVDVTALPESESDRERYRHMYRAAAVRAGADPDEELLAALADATLEVYESESVTVREGAADVLEYARERYAVGLLTNGSPDAQRPKLETLGIADAFDATVFCGPGTGLPSKPDPEPFEVLLDQLDVPAERAVYVGDNSHGDVPGAHNAGMQSVWVPTNDGAADPDPPATHRIDSLRELRRFF